MNDSNDENSDSLIVLQQWPEPWPLSITTAVTWGTANRQVGN